MNGALATAQYQINLRVAQGKNAFPRLGNSLKHQGTNGAVIEEHGDRLLLPKCGWSVISVR
jgi:hypothetical protein